MARTSLYRHFDKFGRLLYVGVSHKHLIRLAQHRKSSPWYWEITRVEIEAHESREEALRAEQLAIDREGPLYNGVVGRPPKKPEDKFGAPKQVTLTPSGWDEVDDYLAAHDLQWMEFVRAAIREKLARDKTTAKRQSQNSVHNGGDDGEKQ